MARERVSQEEENQQEQEQEQEVTKTPEEALQELKENTVPKEDYNKLEKKYNKLFSDVAGGKYAPGIDNTEPTAEEKKKRTEDLMKNLADGKITGPVERTKALCEIDDYYRETQGKSIFEPSYGAPTKDTEESADNLRDILDQALEKADGSDSVFVAAINQRLAGPDDPGAGQRRRN
jgi:hypothetical protein